MIGYAWHTAAESANGINFVLARFIHCMATTAEAHDYHLLTFTHRSDNILDVYAELIETRRVDGFVVSETNVDDDRIRYLLEMDFPFVAFGRANPDWDFPYVDVDGRAGMYQACTHLLALGHRRIGFIGWPEGSLAGDDRYRGYCEALDRAGVACDPRLVRRGSNGVESGYRLAAWLLSLPINARPTAIIAISDMMAIGAMNAVEEHGLQVGQDVAITGFDNMPLVEYLHPPLTSIRQPVDEVARRLINMLARLLSGEVLSEAERHVLVEPELVVRESSGPAR